MPDLLGLLMELSEAFGPSGFEDQVRDLVLKRISDVSDRVWVDPMGNVVAYRAGSSGGRASVVLTAHMDEIGFMVTHVEPSGHLRVVPIGGQSPRVVQGQRVRVRSRSGALLRGVIGSKPPHVMKPDEARQCPEFRDLFVDIGASSRAEAEDMGVGVGSPVAFDAPFWELGRGLVAGKAFDDRAGLAAVIDAFVSASGFQPDLYLVATVQEEVGLRGAQVAVFNIDPTAAVAVDTTIAADVPGTEERDYVTRLGQGPAIKVADNPSSFFGLMANRGLLELLERAARGANLRYQYEVLQGGTTDATAIALTRGGVPAAVVSVPTRYVHSPSEVLSVSDLEGTSRLLRAFVESVSADELRALKERRVK